MFCILSKIAAASPHTIYSQDTGGPLAVRSLLLILRFVGWEIGTDAYSITIDNNIVVSQLFATYHVQFLLLIGCCLSPDIIGYAIK